MTSVRVIAFLTAWMPLQMLAQTADFEDLTLGAAFPIGSQFTSNGLTFDVILFGDSGSPALIHENSSASGFSGQFLNLPNTIGVDFQLPTNTQKIEFSYLAGCCDTGIVVNGVASPLSGSLAGLDGTVIDGVEIMVNEAGASPRTGTLTVTGNISSFIAGGTEFFIDNVSVTVPEPSSLVLICLGGVVFFCRR